MRLQHIDSFMYIYIFCRTRRSSVTKYNIFFVLYSGYFKQSPIIKYSATLDITEYYHTFTALTAGRRVVAYIVTRFISPACQCVKELDGHFHLIGWNYLTLCQLPQHATFCFRNTLLSAFR